MTVAVVDDREAGLGHLTAAELLYVHAEIEQHRRGMEHVGPVTCTQGWWACEWGEAESRSSAQFHGACKPCCLAAAALAINGIARPSGVIAYVGRPDQDPSEFVIIRLAHFTAFYNAHRERHGLPQLLHVDDRVYGWGWS